MAADARVVILKAKAKLSADLAFYDTGVIENAEPVVEFGAQVSAYTPRSALYDRLGELELSDGKPTGRLKFDSKHLRIGLQSKAIVILDNESRAADLDQAILARQNDWLTLYRYIDDDDTFKEINKRYGDKLASLNLLRELVENHHDEIEAAYVKEEKQVDRNMIDDPKHFPTIRPTTINTIKMAGLAALEKGTNYDYVGSDPGLRHGIDQRTIIGRMQGGNWAEFTEPEPTLVAQQITSIVQSDGITHPRIENHMRHERMVADLSDELLTGYVFNKRLSSLKQIWKNELDGIDLEIKNLQLAYIATFLFSPFDGRVTAFYKQTGESARAGDPVARVENESALLLLGQVACPSVPHVGQSVNVVTHHVFGDNTTPTLILNGKVVMVKGVDGLTGRWNVAFDVDNQGAVRIPAGYDFDPDPQITTVTIG